MNDPLKSLILPMKCKIEETQALASSPLQALALHAPLTEAYTVVWTERDCFLLSWPGWAGKPLSLFQRASKQLGNMNGSHLSQSQKQQNKIKERCFLENNKKDWRGPSRQNTNQKDGPDFPCDFHALPFLLLHWILSGFNLEKPWVLEYNSNSGAHKLKS